jgi:methyl-accepting chemotaxis protein
MGYSGRPRALDLAFHTTQAIRKMKQALEKVTSETGTSVREPWEKSGQVKSHFLWYFLLIAMVVLCVGIVLMIQAPGGLRWVGETHPAQAGAYHIVMRWSIAVGLGLIISVTGGVFLLLIRTIADPLAKTAIATERMAEGNLEATLPTGAPNEIGRIAEDVNSLAVNFQEVLTLVWNQTESAMTSLRRTMNAVSSRQGVCSPEILADLDSARQELETMRMMVRSFNLYDVSITPCDLLTAKGNAERLN